MECAASRHVTLCDADSRGFIVVAFCSAILHHWMCKIPTEVATLTKELKAGVTEYIEFYNNKRFHQTLDYKKPMDVYCNLQPQLLLEAA
ncbi:hypothetical protein Psal006b_02360 [Piscirickettsia salmonis]|uniref:Transposase n=1 Tax=Piscirickettsia salmonis TaxID=1238 RepID=A0AAC8VGG9_PISSA|nr:transposase [Piscirickettsia salmonis]ALT18220.1 hypothetical protein PSLF89_04680 [Piscirickettsia salmonis LF-89 = ATCC VR-1361]ALY02170.1 hypothetical protein AWE47_04300 [Piscirickettsia salmonis]AMA41684.1 hypothetical protein AWJ11_04295 [Piscirickettsia salmonis]AOS34166.1 hypothetical protein AVM72_01530 [Piscirickettsia salmonis]